MFRNHPDLGKDRNEIGVAVPAGHHVKMKMVLHPGPGHHSQVEAHVEAVGAHHPPQDGQGLPEPGHQIQHLLLRKVIQAGEVAQGGDKQMPVDVWVFIHHDAGEPAAEEDQPRGQILPRLRAEDATRGLVRAQDIIHAPRGPKNFHVELADSL